MWSRSWLAKMTVGVEMELIESRGNLTQVVVRDVWSAGEKGCDEWFAQGSGQLRYDSVE